MTIVEYISTPTHRYFMRRTKSDIISMMEQMKGERFSVGEHANLMTMRKGELASLAMKIVRSLPNE